MKEIITDTRSSRLEVLDRGDKTIINQENKGVFPHQRTINGVELDYMEVVKLHLVLGKVIKGE